MAHARGVCVLCFAIGLNGAVNGSAACPPTTQPGSFPISPPPVQVANKTAKTSEPSNSHLTSPQHNPAEVVEKPIQKNKEKVGSEMTASYELDKWCLYTVMKLLEGRCVTSSYIQRPFHTASLFESRTVCALAKQQLGLWMATEKQS